MAANIFTGALSSDWGTAGNWSLLAVPTSSDGNVARFDATSPACTINATARVCNHLDCTGYTNTLTRSNQLTISGSVTLDPSMNFASAGQFVVNATSTITSNGKVLSNNLLFQTTVVITIVGDLYVAGTVTTTTQTFNGSAIYCTTSLSVTGSIVAGTSNFHLNGTGTWSGAGTLRNNLLIDSTANLTISGSVYYGTGTLTVDPAATVDTTGSSFYIMSACTLNVNGDITSTSTVRVGGINFNNFITTGGVPTSPVPLRAVGDYTTTYGVSGGIYVNGNFIVFNNTVGTVSAPSPVVMNGTGTWSGVSQMRHNLTIDTLGTVTISGTVTINGITLTITPSSNVIMTGSTLMLAGNCSLDLNNKVLNNLDKNGANSTVTLLSNITCANLLKNSVNGVNFNGFNIYVTSSYGLPGNNGIVDGTTLVNLNGTGITWGSFGNGGYTTNSVNITAGSSVTISGSIKRNAGTLTIDPTATVTTTGSTLWVFSGTQTYNTANTIFDNVYISNTVSGLTFNSKLLANTITIDTTVTFLGSYGFQTPSLILSTIVTGSSKTLTFKNGVEYKVTSSFVSNGTSAYRYTFTSDSGTLKALFTLAYGATQSVNYTNATRIDSSNGQTINASLASVLTDTINWQLTEGNWWLVLNRA